jgi:hypothetical protein
MAEACRKYAFSRRGERGPRLRFVQPESGGGESPTAATHDTTAIAAAGLAVHVSAAVTEISAPIAANTAANEVRMRRRIWSSVPTARKTDRWLNATHSGEPRSAPSLGDEDCSGMSTIGAERSRPLKWGRSSSATARARGVVSRMGAPAPAPRSGSLASARGDGVVTIPRVRAERDPSCVPRDAEGQAWSCGIRIGWSSRSQRSPSSR